MVGFVSSRTRMPPSAPASSRSGVHRFGELGRREDALRAANAVFEGEADDRFETALWVFGAAAWFAVLVALALVAGAGC